MERRRPLSLTGILKYTEFYPHALVHLRCNFGPLCYNTIYSLTAWRGPRAPGRFANAKM